MATVGDRSPGPHGSGDRQGRKQPKLTNTTLRQLAYQVTEGRKVSFWDGVADHPITGYVAGWDSPELGPVAKYFVITPTAEKDEEGFIIQQHLIPQAGTRLELHPWATFDEEEAYKDMEKMISKFRNYVIHNYVGPSESRGRGKPA